MQKPIIRAVMAGLLWCACITLTQAQVGYICLHVKTLNEESSPVFTYTISGGPTTVSPITLSDIPSTRKCADIGGSHGIGGSGGIWVVTNPAGNTGVNGAIVYRRPASSAWILIGDSALAVDGAGPNQCVYANARGWVVAYNAGTRDTLYNPSLHGGHKAVDVANNAHLTLDSGLTVIADDQGHLLAYHADYTNGNDNWTDLSAANSTLPDSITHVDINILNNRLLVSVVNGGVYEGVAAGTVNFLGLPGNLTPYDDVAYDDAGDIYAIARNNGIGGNCVYQWQHGTSWKSYVTSRNMNHITGGAANELWGVNGQPGDAGDRSSLFTLVTDTSNFWYDNEWISAGSGNSVLIPVQPGTYTVTQSDQSSWNCQDIAVYDPALRSSTSITSRSARLSVPAGGVVTAAFQNGLIHPTVISQVCSSTIQQDFGSGTPALGASLTGLTDYHYIASAFPFDGYYTIAKTTGTNWGNQNLVDHTTGTGYFMIVNASYAKDQFYRQRVTGLVPGLRYSLSAYIANLSPAASLKPNVLFGISDATSGTLLGSLSTGNITNTQWQRYSLDFIATTPTADIFLSNNAIGGAGNDLALDDIAFVPIPNPIGPILSLGSDTLCPGTMLTLTDSSANGTWSSLDGGVATVSNTGHVQTLQPGVARIRFSVSNQIGCTASDTVVLTVKPRATASELTTSSPTICAGDTVTLRISSDFSAPRYTWYADSLLRTEVYTGTAFHPGVLQRDTTFYVTVSDLMVCSNRPGQAAKATVTVNQLPPVPDLSGPAALCVGSSKKVDNSTSGGVWSITNPAVATIDQSGVVNGIAPGTSGVRYAVSNAKGCSAQASTSVSVQAIPDVPAINKGTVPSVCGGRAMELSAGPKGNFNYQWYLDGALLPGDSAATISVTREGSYTVAAVSTMQCASPMSAAVEVTARCEVYNDADLSIRKEVTPGPYSVENPVTYTLTVTNNGPGMANDIWISDSLPAELGEPTNFSAPLVPNYANRALSWQIPTLNAGESVTMTFDVSLEALNTIVNTATVTSATPDPDLSNNRGSATIMQDNGIFIPNAVSPNGDGKNDRFLIVGLDRYPGSSLTVFNRWGAEVYHAENYANNWDGHALNDGTYFYVLILNTPHGKQAYKGWVEILHK